MKIGIIGLGNIGGVLAKRFTEVLNSKDIVVFDAHKIKTGKYLKAASSQDLINRSDIVFICIRPQNLKELLSKIDPKDKIFITTVAAIYEKTYYKYVGKIKLIRIIPSMVNKIGGPILLSSGKYVSNTEKNKIKRFLSKFGKIYEIAEKEIDAYTHLSSCSPAIIVEFLKLYLEAVKKAKKIDQEKSLKILVQVLEILTLLLKKEGFELVSQVSTKGGITEQGIKIMNSYKNSFFKDITKTLLKRMEEVRKQYGE